MPEKKPEENSRHAHETKREIKLNGTPQPDPAGQLPKAYDPSIIEQRWAEYWTRERLFDVPTPSAEPGDLQSAPSSSKGPDEPLNKESNRIQCRPTGGPREAVKGRANAFTMLLPPPNVTGRLHMGHMLNQTEMDILARWHRMCGDISLWVPGTDHAGIATQMMVERALAAEGTSRETLGREAFEQRVWDWKKQYGSAITDQMRRLGASVDWSREYFTMDARLSVVVKEAFVRLYERGLIYRGAYIVNWDPIQQTAVSDLEVTHEDRPAKLYHIRYPFADGTGSIVIATTRPETMLGDTAVAVNANDERYKDAIGKLVTLPLSAAAAHADRNIPILADDWANPDFGTGAVKVTPAHDPNDFAIGQRHSLPSLIIMDETAHISLPGSPYHGLDRFAARERIVADLEAAGLLVEVRDHSHAIALSQRSGAVIEPRLSLQWFLAVNKKPEQPTTPGAPFMEQPHRDMSGIERNSIAQTAIDAVAQGHIKFTPDMYAKTYMEWMTNIHDWCISRQLWWGHRIPAWFCADGHITVSRTTPTACSTCGAANIEQSTDVLDTWFSSGLLPFTVFGWPGGATETIQEAAEADAKYIKQVGGVANYAHVRIRITPNQSGVGFAFRNDVDADVIPERFIASIREGVEAAMREAKAQGRGLPDINVSLITGSYHKEDSNETAFRIAASEAFKEAARKALNTKSGPATDLEIAHVKGHGNLAVIEPGTANLTPDLAAFYPTSLLVTGFDILFFWVARMIMLGCHFMLDVPIADEAGELRPRTLTDAVPFKAVYIHALVRDANREKMSKTKGNVIDPIEIIERFGTDAVRFTLASMASPGTDIAFSEARTEGYRAFANKIWNAARFLFMNLDRARAVDLEVTLPAHATDAGAPSKPRLGGIESPGAPRLEEMWVPTPSDPIESRWILARLSQTAAAVNAALAAYRFDEASSAVYQFFWGDLCDWYLEIVKLRLNFDISAEAFPTSEDAERALASTTAALATLVRVFEASLRLLSPFMPFLTEEIWHALYSGTPPAKSIALTRFPQAADFPCDESAIHEMQMLQELIVAVRALRKELGVPEKESAPIRLHAGPDLLAHLEFRQEILDRLARVSAIEISEKPLTGASARSNPAFDVAVIYAKQIDIPAERERLGKELAKLEKQIAANEARLADASFTARAPAHIVDGLRKQTADLITLRDKTRAALDSLG